MCLQNWKKITYSYSETLIVLNTRHSIRHQDTKTKLSQTKTNKKQKLNRLSSSPQFLETNNLTNATIFWISKWELGHGGLHKGNMKKLTLLMPFSQRPSGTCPQINKVKLIQLLQERWHVIRNYGVSLQEDVTNSSQDLGLCKVMGLVKEARFGL